MIPVALGRGPGGSSIRGIALVLIGGQTLCLLITPVAFSLFDDLEAWLRNLRKPPGRLKLVEAGYEIQPEPHAAEGRLR